MRKLHLFTNKSPESSINQFRFVFFGVRELFCVVLGQFSAVQLKLNSVSGSFFVIQHFEKMEKKNRKFKLCWSNEEMKSKSNKSNHKRFQDSNKSMKFRSDNEFISHNKHSRINKLNLFFTFLNLQFYSHCSLLMLTKASNRDGPTEIKEEKIENVI